MKTAHAFSAVAEIPPAIRPEYASMAVVYVPELAREPAGNDMAAEIVAWARHATRSSGFGAPEAADSPEPRSAEARPQESLLAIFCRLAASWAR
jgi:hypothetical protein